MSYTEKQIVLMLRAGIEPAEVIAAIERGDHMHWKPGRAV